MSEQTVMRTFAEVLPLLEDGQLVEDLTDGLKDVIAALNNAAMDGARKPKGELNLKLKFSMEDGIIEVVSEIKTTQPKQARGKTVMWATADNNLSRNNPKQRGLFEDVNETSRPVRSA